MIASKLGASLLVACTVMVPGLALCADADSRYVQLADNQSVADGARKTLASVAVDGGHAFLISATGSLIPGGKGLAKIYITVDDKIVSNVSAVDWTQTPNPAEHSFSAISAPTLSGGSHRVSVIAEGSASFSVRAGMNLAIMGDPARNVSSATQNQPSPVISVDTSSVIDGLTTLPGNPLLSLHRSDQMPQTVLLVSGNATFSGQGTNQYGDAMWALQTDGTELASDRQSYAANDIWFNSEVSAPLYIQGLIYHSEGGTTLGFKPTVEPWLKSVGIANPVHYRVTNQTTFVALSDGFKLFGGLSSLPQVGATNRYSRFKYRCVGSSRNTKNCPTVGSPVQLATGTIEVPEGHNGVIYFSGITRVQGGKGDGGGSVTVNILIDGRIVGSTAHQVLTKDDAISTRTVAVSYLSAGDKSLSPGRHTVSMTAKVDGDFLQLAIPKGLSLIWFD